MPPIPPRFVAGTLGAVVVAIGLRSVLDPSMGFGYRPVDCEDVPDTPRRARLRGAMMALAGSIAVVFAVLP